MSTESLGAPSNFGCTDVMSMWAEAESRKAEGKRRYRNMDIEKWFAKWRPRYNDCRGTDTTDTAVSDSLDTLSDSLEQTNEQSDSIIGTLTSDTNKVLIVMAVVTVIIVLALVGFSLARR